MNPDTADSCWEFVVVDTNVLLSAALCPTNVPARVVNLLLQSSRLVFSGQTFAELETRIWKPKFDRYLSPETRKGLLHDFSAAGHWVEIPQELSDNRWSVDEDDDHFIRAAMASGARRLITGDTDLLVLKEIGALQICTPRTALDELLKASS